MGATFRGGQLHRLYAARRGFAALLAGLCCKLPKVLRGITTGPDGGAGGGSLPERRLPARCRAHPPCQNLAAYQFFVRTIETGLADAVQSDDLILCNENVWDSNAEAGSPSSAGSPGAPCTQGRFGPRTLYRRRRLAYHDLPQLRRLRSGVVRQTAKAPTVT